MPRLVAITGWGQPKDRHATKEAGFDIHLVKPVSPTEIVALIRKHLGAVHPHEGHRNASD